MFGKRRTYSPRKSSFACLFMRPSEDKTSQTIHCVSAYPRYSCKLLRVFPSPASPKRMDSNVRPRQVDFGFEMRSFGQQCVPIELGAIRHPGCPRSIKADEACRLTPVARSAIRPKDQSYTETIPIKNPHGYDKPSYLRERISRSIKVVAVDVEVRCSWEADVRR